MILVVVIRLYLFVSLFCRYISSLAITFCGNTCAEQLARDVFPVLVPLMSGDNPYIQKKVCLAMIKVITLVPEMIEDMVRSLPALLIDNDHGVLISGTFTTNIIM